MRASMRRWSSDSVDGQADEDGGEGALGASGLEGGEGGAGGVEDLEGADDAADVLGIDAGGGLWIHCCEIVLQRLPAVIDRALFERGPVRRVGWDLGQQEAVAHGADVQAGAAHQHGHARSGADARDGLQRLLLIHRQGIRLVGIDDVEQMVGQARALREGGLGGADVHPAVDRSGVGRDDFHREVLGQRQRQGGLAGGGRANDDWENR